MGKKTEKSFICYELVQTGVVTLLYIGIEYIGLGQRYGRD
jgi:hypothetical protein